MVQPSLTCRNCGQPGAIEYPAYVGGQGMVKQVGCNDQVACWDRWNEQHGFVFTTAKLKKISLAARLARGEALIKQLKEATRNTKEIIIRLSEAK